MTSTSDKKKPTGERKSSDESGEWVTIKVVKHEVDGKSTNEDEKPVAPVLVSFPSGLPAALRPSRDAGRAKMPEFIWRQDKTELKSKEKKITTIVAGEDDTCYYKATHTAQPKDSKPKTPSDPRTSSRIAVGIYDKETKTVTMHLAACNGHVFRMAQCVPSYLREQSNPSAAADLTIRYGNVLDFGSSKSKKKFKANALGMVNMDLVVGAKGYATAGEQKTEEGDRREGGGEAATGGDADVDPTILAWRKNFLPEYDSKTEEPKQIYKPSCVVGSNAWSQVSRIVHAVLYKAKEKGWAKAKTMKAFLSNKIDEEDRQWEPFLFDPVLRLLENFDPTKTDSEISAKKEQLKCALSLQYFMQMLKIYSNKNFFLPIKEDSSMYMGVVPIDIAKSFIETFTTQANQDFGKNVSGHGMSKANKDRCHLYLFLLFIMTMNHEKMRASIRPLADALKIGSENALQLLKLAGFEMKLISKEYWVLLKAPLVLPTPFKRKRN